VGKRLLKFTEEEIVRRGGKMLLVETSSQETYGGTIQFYERTGYELVGKIKEYYKPGDDKLIFAKRLAQSVPADRVAPAEASISRTLVAEATPQAL
jgi:ribosomal protein S18 acetylase RimI-like enzyme